MWSVRAEHVDSSDAVALLRDYFAELTVRYFHRETTAEEIDETLDEYPSTGLALFLLLRAGGVRAGCLGLHPTGEITRMYVSPAGPVRRSASGRRRPLPPFPPLSAGRCASYARVGSPSAATDMYTWTMPKQKRPFLVEIEAKLTVHAFDEDSARKKVEKAFASGRPLGVDVDAGAGVWTYAVVPAEQASGS